MIVDFESIKLEYNPFPAQEKNETGFCFWSPSCLAAIFRTKNVQRKVHRAEGVRRAGQQDACV
jgi:hypothetical protein